MQAKLFHAPARAPIKIRLHGPKTSIFEVDGPGSLIFFAYFVPNRR